MSLSRVTEIKEKDFESKAFFVAFFPEIAESLFLPFFDLTEMMKKSTKLRLSTFVAKNASNKETISLFLSLSEMVERGA